MPNIDLDALVDSPDSYMPTHSDDLSSFAQPQARTPLLPSGPPHDSNNADLIIPYASSAAEVRANDSAHDEQLRALDAEFDKMQLSNSVKGFFGPSSTYRYFSVRFMAFPQITNR